MGNIVHKVGTEGVSLDYHADVSWRHRGGQRLGLLVIRRLTPGFRIAYDRTGVECNGLRRTVTGRRRARTRSALGDRVFRPRAPPRLWWPWVAWCSSGFS